MYNRQTWPNRFERVVGDNYLVFETLANFSTCFLPSTVPTSTPEREKERERERERERGFAGLDQKKKKKNSVTGLALPVKVRNKQFTIKMKSASYRSVVVLLLLVPLFSRKKNHSCFGRGKIC